MKRFRLALAAMLACVLMMVGDATAGPAPDQSDNLPPVRADTIARLAVDGKAAYINKKPAYHGSYVYSGDRVHTGPGTSVILVLNDGGTIQLDENTDPDFFKLLKEGACVVMKLAAGQAFVDKKSWCVRVEVERPEVALVLNSTINLKVTDQEAWLTVLEGRIEMISPRPATLTTNDRYIAAIDGTVDIQRLTRADAVAAGAWRQRYFGYAQAQPQSQAQQPGGLSVTEKAIIGFGGIYILDRILRGRHDKATQPDATAAGGPAQTAIPGWCCSPNGRGFSSNATACTRLKGTFYPGATSSNVCPSPLPHVPSR